MEMVHSTVYKETPFLPLLGLTEGREASFLQQSIYLSDERSNSGSITYPLMLMNEMMIVQQIH